MPHCQDYTSSERLAGLTSVEMAFSWCAPSFYPNLVKPECHTGPARHSDVRLFRGSDWFSSVQFSMVIHDDMATPASSVATSGGGKSQASLSSQRLTCKICGATFVYPGSFTKHMQRHEMSNKRNQESSSSPILAPYSTPVSSMVLSSQKGLQQVAPQPVSPVATVATIAPSMSHGYFANSRGKCHISVTCYIIVA